MKVLPLYDRADNFLDWALVDDDVFERAEQYTWRRESYERKNGEPREYAFASIDGVRTRLHHLVMGLPTVDEDVIDHRNHDGLNNLKCNLRQASGRQNGQNAYKPWDSLSEYIGVTPKKNYWGAACGGVYLGQYETEIEAATAHDQAAIRMYGEGALTNGFSEEDVPKRVSCRLDRELPLGVTRGPGKVRPFVTQCNSRYVGAFSTADEAHDAYVQAKIANEQKRVADINALPILRNDEGVAIVNMYDREGEVKAQVLVDDNSWHELMLYRWYFDGQYATTKIDQVNIKMHCFLMKSKWIDHRSGNKLDNRDANMRKITRSGNSQNTVRNGKIPDYQGVSRSKSGNRFEATITCNGIQYYLGSFRTAEAAALAYNSKALELFDEPKLNKVDPSLVDDTDSNIKVRAGKSIYRGVSPFKKRWRALAQKDKVEHRGGSWFTEEEAALAYNVVAAQLFKNPRRNLVTLTAAHAARFLFLDDYLDGRGVSLSKKKYRVHISKGPLSYDAMFNSKTAAVAVYRKKWFDWFYTEYDTQVNGWSLEAAVAQLAEA